MCKKTCLLSKSIRSNKLVGVIGVTLGLRRRLHDFYEYLHYDDVIIMCSHV